MLSSGQSRPPTTVLRELRAALNGSGPPVGAGDGATVPSGTVAILRTSGSTGVPKAVILSRNAITASALATAERIGRGRWMLALPAEYIAGLQVLARSLIAGHEPAILAGRFSPRAFAAVANGMASTVGGSRVDTFTSVVPAQLTALLDAADADAAVRRALGGFAAILVGGQAVSPVLLERAADAGARIVRSYGSSETAGGCVYDGVPLRDVGVRVVDGEVQCSGPTLADGYLGDPELTERTFVRDRAGVRWYRTGDAGELRNGVLSVRGRLDNVIVSGGVNVSLDLVQAVAREDPRLSNAVAVPVTDSRWGEGSVLVLSGSIPEPDARAALVEARERIACRLGRAARPRQLLIVDGVPLLASGKPDLPALRALAETVLADDDRAFVRHPGI